MPKDTSLQTILVIGSGPIVIGQAAEFDYAGTQGCLALKEEGYKIILVNSNPATIMTDEIHADAVYFEPLTMEVITRIIEKEKPDGLLATLGGQTGLNLAYELYEGGILEKYKVRLLGTPIESIKKGEDRELFRNLMYEINEPVPESSIINTVEDAVSFAEKIGFPIIIRPAYTLGGTGGGIAENMEQYHELVRSGLQESAIHQCLVEKSIAGFKEVEYEVMRDASNTCITICNMENIDPVGIHTGDSIVVAPSQTLTDEEYNLLRSASIKIISSLGIIGGCNIQFALDPQSKKYYLIEVNPRVSRSSALASKATGYPIARIAAKLAVGYTLDELVNPVTKSTYASFEPALDYTVVKFPRWPFDKFPEAYRKLGTQMKATGEVMAIERSLEAALQKAIVSLELKVNGLEMESLKSVSVPDLVNLIKKCTDERLFVIFELLRRGITVSEIHQATEIDYFYLNCFKNLIDTENEIYSKALETVEKEQLQAYKEQGFQDSFLAHAWNVSEAEIRSKRRHFGVISAYKMVDTCAAEFESNTNYFYSTYFGENEQKPSSSKKVLVIGSGPIRIGQGIEFDYCSVHAVYALKEKGYEAVMINNNPETVSTDFATSDRLYFEPLTLESVLNVIEAEQIESVLVQFGGQTAINLAKGLEENGVKLLGTSFDTLDQTEDRSRFYQLLQKLNIPHVPGYEAANEEEVYQLAGTIGFPVLLRPSYVIGGRGMLVFDSLQQLKTKIQDGWAIDYPVLIDKYIPGMEAEVDVIADGESAYIPMVVEHIEKAGVHSGDSMAYLPAQTISSQNKDLMSEYARRIVKELNYKGLMNIQFVLDSNKVYVLEVNPRASRTIPIISKLSGVSMVQIATKILLGKYSLSNVEETHSPEFPFIAVKYPVFSTYALSGLDSKIGPEMKSTGEGISISNCREKALQKAFLQKNKNFTVQNEILISSSVNLSAEHEALIAEKGFTIIKNVDLESWFQGGKGAAVLAWGISEEDQRLREKAVKYRHYMFSEPETFQAFLDSAAADTITVTSLQEWQKKNKVGVR
ncbi:carbamoyl-phosphate synthase large subunit [Peribacillus deserti]|uniref:Carbamoyl phosphate synthase large chain n=1 Tax=Peribacillus deserti TaxID=673318 RepID=A0ABS2QLI3_9BACI|nr:carbamoyl phosphate synthase large subunit [Peribacillus deserti]MBM7693972.1 carbamoyl-phosphate synthase large subunit [Peribacillus deserti]